MLYDNEGNNGGDTDERIDPEDVDRMLVMFDSHDEDCDEEVSVREYVVNSILVLITKCGKGFVWRPTR